MGFFSLVELRFRWRRITDLTTLPTVHLSRGPSPISLSTQEAWPVAAAITEYINAYFKGGQHNRSVWPTNMDVCKVTFLTRLFQRVCVCPAVW